MPVNRCHQFPGRCRQPRQQRAPAQDCLPQQRHMLSLLCESLADRHRSRFPSYYTIHKPSSHMLTPRRCHSVVHYLVAAPIEGVQVMSKPPPDAGFAQNCQRMVGIAEQAIYELLSSCCITKPDSLNCDKAMGCAGSMHCRPPTGCTCVYLFVGSVVLYVMTRLCAFHCT
jgi:hypothetical protein